MSEPAAPAVDARAGSAGTRIDLDGVCRWFKVGGTVVKAVDQVNLHVDEAAFVVVLGASGSGKTTLLNLVGALDAPTAGTIRLAGQDLTAACADQVGHTRFAAQAAAFTGEPLHQRQDGHLVHLAEAAEPGLHFSWPRPVGPRHPGGVPPRQGSEPGHTAGRCRGHRPVPWHRSLPG